MSKDRMPEVGDIWYTKSKKAGNNLCFMNSSQNIQLGKKL